jgi:hypothetical protein
MEFQEFDSIEPFESGIVISEKIHGSNAQIWIFEYTSTDGQSHEPRLGIKAGSRTRWVTPEDDNYGFARWVDENKDALIKSLGVGRHFGEWYGSGIGVGYGLKEKRFALFNTHRWTEPKQQGLLPDRVDVVPILYQGIYKRSIVEETMGNLKMNGSALVPGFKKPEGIVIYFARAKVMFKHVFENETVAWDRKEKAPKPSIDLIFEAKVNSYLQPVRLEKLFMRDQKYKLGYPDTLPEISKDYVEDLLKESDPIDPIVLKAIKQKTFHFIKENIKNG